MSVKCLHCGRLLQFSGEAPSFCAYCGRPLSEGPTPSAALDRTTASPPTPAGETTAPARTDGALPSGLEAIGGYRLVRPLGSGGMGTVYEAEHAASGRRVALKLIAASFAASEDAVERFRQEGRLASMVVHPRCVFVLGADEEAGRPYIVMELMPGTTLKDLLDRGGPLPVEEAVQRALDVLEGLQEAHGLGVIHRDVKPSNCFLDAEGRVKIGDFGLSKSLLREAHLTQSGAFLGTPLFASPEQVRGERLDAQSDVYSLAATLYCLLTGRAPFEGHDAAVTLARIASDPVPPLRTLKPELPTALDQAVLRGLERERSRRWRNLEEFRAALLPFAPGQLTAGGLSIRFAAYLLDYLVLIPASVVQLVLDNVPETAGLGSLGVSCLIAVYFAILEGRWGASLGKRFFRLRVWLLSSGSPPGLGRGLVRSGVWALLLFLPTVPTILYPPEQTQHDPLLATWVGGAGMAALVVCTALVLCTMRARNGYRGLHEFLSGTRVVLLPEVERRRPLPGWPMELRAVPAEDLPERLGAFAVRGVLRSRDAGRLLLAEDPVLARRVVIELRPRGSSPLSAARREVSRATRLRWLAGGVHVEAPWDAFLAPAGWPLSDLETQAGRLPWEQARPLLEQLTDELAAATADGTLPDGLALEQVWVQADGRVQLLDAPLAEVAGHDGPLDLVRKAAGLLLEGSLRATIANEPIRAPVPGHASALLRRLAGVERSYADVGQLQEDFASTRMQPVRLRRGRRGAHLAVLTALLWVGLFVTALPGFIPSWQVMGLTMQVELDEQALADLRAESARELAIAMVNPELPVRLGGLGQFAADEELIRRLDLVLERNRREREARLRAMSWYTRYATEEFERQAEASQRPLAAAPRSPQFVRGFAEVVALQNADEKPASRLVGLMVLWPAVWVVWAFLTRGGWSLPLLGISLVGRDGRKAGRLRCAWRACIVWAPILGLLAGSVWLDLSYWEAWTGEEGFAPVLWLSWAAWWLGLGLLAAYLGLALWYPERSWHDRLAGTYLVPR